MITVKRDRAGRFQKMHSCDSCQLIRINGIICHEIGCPDSWKDKSRECKWCGADFIPEDRDQHFCEESCAESYHS